MSKLVHVHLPYDAHKRGYFIKTTEREPLLFSLSMSGKRGRLTLLALKDFEVYSCSDSLFMSCRAGSEVFIVEGIDDLQASDEVKEFAKIQRRQGKVVVLIDGYIYAVETKVILDSCI